MQLVTGLFTGIYFFLYLFLSMKVIRARRDDRTPYGFGGTDHLKGLVAAHSNFASYVPLFVLLTLMLELSEAFPMWLHFALHGLFLIGRGVHMVGLTVMERKGNYTYRVKGMQMTFAALSTAAALNIWAFGAAL